MTKLLFTLGSYERSIYGVEYVVDVSHDSASIEEAKNAYAFVAHTGCIKSIAGCSRFLASGSTDETIRIFDLSKRKDVGTLTSHAGSVTCLAFVAAELLISGSEDGFICMYSTADWEEVRRIKAHKHGISSLSVHPSGKLMLSVGQDNKLRMWDLRSGKLAYARRTSLRSALGISFSPDGTLYAIFNRHQVHVFRGDECIYQSSSIVLKSLLCIHFVGNDTLLVGGEGKLIQCISLSSGSSCCLETDLMPRIKSMLIYHSVLFATSSDGTIRCYQHDLNNQRLIPLSSLKSGLRATCSTCSIIQEK